ncbi:uncharacterized protein A1O9_13015 [Exophiala aquamarina CBS 119918]|uniref:C2H2-type domain-containing protein n=1 Tax=Exophiala aquamarina CBS 119918 TaxID=1182545 RepID=A0A072P5P1_9EURO|nr:uncharacterized protein A1O9_13015 [Exophiala aquamarina CBS 119918]KEF50935.1 hypothetical protein A1O9_13015 [Exophiala aquamarina CBS 119918]
MTQPTSPSMSLPDGTPNGNPTADSHCKRSNSEVPIDPSISQASPTYPPYSPYPPGQDMQRTYQAQHPPYMQQRPPHEQWGGYPPQHVMSGPNPHLGGPGVQAAPQTSAASRPGQVYSFVLATDAERHKRKRRRQVEIQRIYKCGWNGCTKAYGTLNHLNTHVAAKTHGTKRTSQESKEIRNEWKARKKGEEKARKAEEEQQGAATQATQAGGHCPYPDLL